MKQLNGNEEFTLNGENYGITVNNFWSWAYSDLLNNTSRGILAEFLVAKSFSQTPSPEMSTRIDWTPCDLTSPSGKRIEVKSSAYLQSWSNNIFSRIIFDIAPKRAWNPDTGYSAEISRHSDIYVFCVYTATNREQSILNLDLWDFYVLPTAVLDRERPAQKSISLSALIRLQPTKVKFPDLGKTIESM